MVISLLWTISSIFFESLLLLRVGLFVSRATRLELHLATPEELTDTIGMRVLYAMTLSKELVGLRDSGYLPFFIASFISSMPLQ